MSKNAQNASNSGNAHTPKNGARYVAARSLQAVFEQGLPAVNNSARAAEIARSAAWDATSVDKVISQGYPSLGGEDFSFYQHYVEGCLVRFGAMLPGSVGPAHSSTFDFDEKCLKFGASWLAGAGWRWLNTNGRPVVSESRIKPS